MTKEPWNKNKSVGQKKAFTPRQIEVLRQHLTKEGKTMELALLNFGLDTMLRYGDTSKIKVEDVLDYNGKIKDVVNLKQQKTKSSHLVKLYDTSKDSIKSWINESKKYEDDYLFTATFKGVGQRKEKISRTTYSGIIKNWAIYLGLDPKDYASHTLRRTRAVFLYKNDVDIETIRILLGQKSIESTKNYLGIELEDAHEVSKKFVI
jgi:integrase